MITTNLAYDKIRSHYQLPVLYIMPILIRSDTTSIPRLYHVYTTSIFYSTALHLWIAKSYSRKFTTHCRKNVRILQSKAREEHKQPIFPTVDSHITL